MTVEQVPVPFNHEEKNSALSSLLSLFERISEHRENVSIASRIELLNDIH